MRSSALFALCLLALFALTGCVTENRAEHEATPPPWPEEAAPAALHELAEDMQAFQAAIGHLPDDLAQLDHSGLATGGPYAANGFAYHPASMGILRAGWRVLVADDRVREAGKVWCVVRPPIVLRGEPGLRVLLIPVGELREAAASAGVR